MRCVRAAHDRGRCCIRIVADFIAKDRVEDDRDHCKRKDDHASEETLDRSVAIDHEYILRRRFIGHLVRERLADVLPDQIEQLRATKVTVRREQSMVVLTVKHIRLNSIVHGYSNGLSRM